jgi:hypothetical protein
MAIKKRSQIWLTPVDEENLSGLLRDALPQIHFIDGQTWEEMPVLKASMSLCKTPFIFLWNSNTVTNLPTFIRPDGRIEGPASGVVIQYLRSLERHGILESGSIAAGSDKPNEEYNAFVKTVWRIVKTYCKGVDAVNPVTGKVLHSLLPNMLVGREAAIECESGIRKFLKYKSTENYYRPH